MNRLASALALLVLAGCGERIEDYSFALDRGPRIDRICEMDSRLRVLLGDRSANPGRLRGILDTLDGLLSPSPPGTPPRAVARAAEILSAKRIAPQLHPSDSDLVPSLAWERKRAGCVPLVLFWSTLLRSQGIPHTPALLPGHVAIRLPGATFLESLRGGIERDSLFYASSFSLGSRPYYAAIRGDTNAILASMLVQAGLLEWRLAKLKSAESALRTASLLCPGLPEAEGNLGLVLVALRRPELALPRLEKALAGDPSNVRARTLRDSLVRALEMPTMHKPNS